MNDSETPWCDAVWNDPAYEADHVWAVARRLEKLVRVQHEALKEAAFMVKSNRINEALRQYESLRAELERGS
jgi:type II restriction/modification system DNA methylase subunit YeeA